ncbi:MAG: hypothetical protein WBF67_10535 [Olleya sp.]
MTLLKKVTYLLLAMLFFACSNENETKANSNSKIDSENKFLGEEIAKMTDGQLKILNPEKLKFEFKKSAKKQGYSPEYSNEFRLTEGDEFNEDFESYLLIITSIDGSMKTAIEVVKQGDSFFMTYDGTTVTCTGCRRGCDPSKKNGKWICSDCEIPNSNCTKTVSVEIEE